MNKPEGHKYPRKEKGDWAVVGTGKPAKSIVGEPEMHGRKWTINVDDNDHKDFGKLKEYEEIESGDSFNVSSKSKGDLDYILPQDGAEYKDYFDMGDIWSAHVQEKNPFVPIKNENELKGGIGDATGPSDVNPSELAMGVQIEMEHTTDEKVATEIALDHLTKEPFYYTKLNQAGLTDEFKTVSPSGYGDPTSTFNQEDRLGSTVTCGPGNNIVGGIDKTPDGHVDGKRHSDPIVNKTVDIEVKDPEFNDLREAILESKKSNKKLIPSNKKLWKAKFAMAKKKYKKIKDINAFSEKEYKKAGGKWKNK